MGEWFILAEEEGFGHPWRPRRHFFEASFKSGLPCEMPQAFLTSTPSMVGVKSIKQTNSKTDHMGRLLNWCT